MGMHPAVVSRCKASGEVMSLHADVPVRMALGETHVIALTKRALGESGVNVDALEGAAAASGKAAGQRRVERSGSVLLVKNLPYTASESELQVTFLSLMATLPSQIIRLAGLRNCCLAIEQTKPSALLTCAPQEQWATLL